MAHVTRADASRRAVERGTETFDAMHVAAAERLANEARKAGVESLVHISGIGADAQSPSPYIRARGQGGQSVRAIFRRATVIRPAVMFGLDDTFLNTLIKLLRRLPIYPMFGRGETRLQLTDVEDVAEAVAKMMQRTETAGLTVECGGPRVYSYEELLRTSTFSERETHAGAGAVRCLARPGLDRRDATRNTRHA